MDYEFVTACPKCGKKKALKTVATVVGSLVYARTTKCRKCGYALP